MFIIVIVAMVSMTYDSVSYVKTHQMCKLSARLFVNYMSIKL